MEVCRAWLRIALTQWARWFTLIAQFVPGTGLSLIYIKQKCLFKKKFTLNWTNTRMWCVRVCYSVLTALMLHMLTLQNSLAYINICRTKTGCNWTGAMPSNIVQFKTTRKTRTNAIIIIKCTWLSGKVHDIYFKNKALNYSISEVVTINFDVCLEICYRWHRTMGPSHTIQ